MVEATLISVLESSAIPAQFSCSRN